MTDEHDDELLRQALTDRSGGPVEAGSGRQAIVARAARVRTVRTAAVGGTAATVVIIGLFALPAMRNEPFSASELPAPSVDMSDPSATTSTSSTPVGDTLPPGVTVILPPSQPDQVGPTTSMLPSTTTALPVSAPPPTSRVPSTPPSLPTTTWLSSPTTLPTPSSTTTSTTTSPPADPPFTNQYSSPGGSITVDWDGSVLSLLAVDPNDGFEAEIEDATASRIRVRFRSDSGDARIEVRVEAGQVESTIT